MANTSQVNCKYELRPLSSTPPRFASLSNIKDLYQPDSFSQAPLQLGAFMGKIWQTAINASLGETDWASLSPNYAGIVPLALAVSNPRNTAIQRWARCYAAVALDSEGKDSLKETLRGGEDAGTFPVRVETYGKIMIATNTPYLAYGCEPLWKKLAIMMSPVPNYANMCTGIINKLPDSATITSFLFSVRILFTRAMARLCTLTTVKQSAGYIKIMLQPRTTIDLKTYVHTDNEKVALDIYGALFRILIQNMDVFMGIGQTSSMWKEVVGSSVLNYKTYTEHPLYQAYKVANSNGTIELCFSDEQDAQSVTTKNAEESFVIGGANDTGGYDPHGQIDHEDEEDDSDTKEDMYSSEEKSDPIFGPTTKDGDIVGGSPLQSDDITDVLVDDDVVGTFTAVAYADDSTIKRNNTFNEVDLAAFSAQQLMSLASYYAFLGDKYAYPSKWSESLEEDFVQSKLVNYIDGYLAKGGSKNLYTPPIVPDVTKLTVALNKAYKTAATKCDPAQLRLIASGRAAEWYQLIADEIPEDERDTYLTPLGYFVLSSLPSDWDAYCIAGPDESELEDDQLCYNYGTCPNHTPFVDAIVGSETLAYVATDKVVRHEGPVSVPRVLNASACQHTMLGGLSVASQAIDCRPEVALARVALSRLKDLKEVSADVKPGGVRGAAMISPAARKSTLLPTLVGAIGAGATVITDAVAIKKEMDKN